MTSCWCWMSVVLTLLTNAVDLFVTAPLQQRLLWWNHRSSRLEGASLQLGPISATVVPVHCPSQRRLLQNQRFIHWWLRLVEFNFFHVDVFFFCFFFFCFFLNVGEPFYEAVRPIAAHTELIVFDLPGHSDEEELYLPAVRSLRSSLFRRTMGLILEGSNLFFFFNLLIYSIVDTVRLVCYWSN